MRHLIPSVCFTHSSDYDLRSALREICLVSRPPSFVSRGALSIMGLIVC